MSTRRTTPTNSPYVSREELHALNDHFDKRFLSVDNAIKDVNNTIQHIADKIDNIAKPKYDMLLSLIGIMLVVISLFGTLTYTFISNVDEKVDLRLNGTSLLTKEDQVMHEDLQRKQFDRIEDEFRSRSIENRILIEKLSTIVDMQTRELENRGSWMKESTELSIRNDERLQSVRDNAIHGEP